MALESLDKDQLVQDVLTQFEQELSFNAIANQVVKVVDSIRL